MKANELRIGNYVSVTWNGSSEITEIEQYHVRLKDGFSDIESLRPIPLTKEWLLKFGFNANRYNDEFELYPLMFDCEYTDHGEWNISYDGHPLSTEVKYVHQLQNLYFALTGEELTLKS